MNLEYFGHKPRFVFLILLIAPILLAASLYSLGKGESGQISRNSDKQKAEIISKISKELILPADEQPTIITVLDPYKLIGRPFFAKAKKGDKVIIYSRAGRAILFDPAADKIIEIGPVNLTR